MTTRLDIETAILHAIVYYDGYPQVAHILSAKNFTSTDINKNREIYGVIASMFPSKPIDLVTVSQELRKAYPNTPEITNALLDFKLNIHSSANIVYWAFILLQLDICDKYRLQLISWKDTRDRELQYVESGALKEMIEMLTPEIDVFEFIEKAVQYFESMQMDTELTETREFFSDLTTRAQQIRKVSSVHTALRYLFAITQSSNQQVRYECEKMAQAIADMITTGQTNTRYTEAVNLIHK